MSGQVLIVDTLPARRLLVRAALRAAHYVATPWGRAQEAPDLAAALRPDLVLIGLDEGAAALAAVAAIKARGPLAPPVIALAPPDRPGLRLAALRAGADDAADHGTPDRLLQARIRSLLRARAAEAEMREEEGAAEAFGLAEAPAGFAGRAGVGRVAVVAAGSARCASADGLRHGGAALDHLGRALGCAIRVLPPSAHPADAPGSAADLFLIDASDAASDDAGGDALRLLADLRSRAPTRHSATLVLLPPGSDDTAAMALDLGAGDVASVDTGPEELAERARALLGRKSQADRLRDRVRSGLQAAVRDPLTGLHNRRYAEPALARMAEQARATGGDLAVMILDIDHFKAINDTFGHAVGDRVLAEVARRLQGSVRPGDLVARFGGEEFVVAIADTTPEAARATAERLRRAVASQPFAPEPVIHEPAFAAPRHPEEALLAWGPAMGRGGGHGGGGALAARRPAPVPAIAPEGAAVTLSIGVAIGASARPGIGLTVADLLERADGALYAAKSAGRNLVAMALGAA